MKISAALLSTLCVSITLAKPLQSLDFSSYGIDVTKRADPSLVGYLGVFFLGDEPSVYFYRSNGNDPLSLTALNGGQPVIVPTLGTGGVRDPTIIPGGGDEAGKKWYIIGTDLDIGTVSASKDSFESGARKEKGERRILANRDYRRPGTPPNAPAPAASSSGKAPTSPPGPANASSPSRTKPPAWCGPPKPSGTTTKDSTSCTGHPNS